MIVAVNKYILLIFGVTVVIIVAAMVALSNMSTPPSNSKIDIFAQCLTQKGVTMYGAYWCPHCQAQKKLFGESFKYVKYVECTQNVKLCQEKKIDGYPAWTFKDGSRLSGELSFEKLAEKTSCSAPK